MLFAGRSSNSPEAPRIQIRRGLDLPISGKPEQVVANAPPVSSVAICGRDFVGLRPKLWVDEGERVRLGDPLFSDRRDPQIRFTSPGCGVVSGIHYGPRRTLRSVIITLEGSDEATFPHYRHRDLSGLSQETVRESLLASGLWTVFRTRPFGRIPASSSSPRSIFVNATDSNPLAADPEVVIAESRSEFAAGLRVVGRLTEGRVYLCRASTSGISDFEIERLQTVIFDGPHPSGLPGTHIHFLDPVSSRRTVWYLHYQDVIRLGKLFTSGRYPTQVIVALGGPSLRRPRLLRTRIGSDLVELVTGELPQGERARIISGSVLSGRVATNAERFLGCRHLQVSVIPDGEEATSTGTQSARRRFSVHAWSRFLGRRSYRMTTALQGAPSAMISTGSFERLMPLNILATPLLRALAVGDIDRAEALGCLELEEEDLALCTFVCPGKLEYGTLLRSMLNRLEREG